MATKRKTGKKKSVVDSAVRNAALLSDGWLMIQNIMWGMTSGAMIGMSG